MIEHPLCAAACWEVPPGDLGEDEKVKTVDQHVRRGAVALWAFKRVYERQDRQ